MSKKTSDTDHFIEQAEIATQKAFNKRRLLELEEQKRKNAGINSRLEAFRTLMLDNLEKQERVYLQLLGYMPDKDPKEVWKKLDEIDDTCAEATNKLKDLAQEYDLTTALVIITYMELQHQRDLVISWQKDLQKELNKAKEGKDNE